MSVFLTHAYYLDEDPREQRIMKPYVPLGILYIAAYLDKHGIGNRVFDSTFSNFGEQCREILRSRPPILAIYVNLMTRLQVLRLIRFVKSEPSLAGTRVVLGGPEVRESAANFLRAGADFVVTGEGEETMLELTRAILDRTTDYSTIRGIVYANGTACVQTAPRPNIRDINTLPFPAREKVDLNPYFNAWKSRHGESTLSVSTMRGCPYTCKWCSRAVYGQSYRRRDPERVADELVWISEHYKVDTLWFVDDVFTISYKWLEGFHHALQKRALTIRYECITRADRMNDEVIGLLKATGCFRVWIGAESGSQRIIDAMDRRVQVTQVRDMIRRTRGAGMQAGTFIMLGYPGETEADIRETLHHLRESEPDHYTVTIAYPIRGTPLYAETEPGFLHAPAWDEGTDRQIDFKRTYNRAYYDYAVRWIANEMALHRNRRRNGPVRPRITHLLKARAARLAMALCR